MVEKESSVAIWMNNSLQLIKEGNISTNKHLCHLCGQLYSCKYTLDRHLNLKHEQDSITQCPLCFYHTNRLDNLHRHYRLKHKLVQPYPEGFKMPALAKTETTHIKPAKKTLSPAEDKEQPSTSQKSEEHDYFKYPDSTGAYIYLNTLRKGQEVIEWVPQNVDFEINNIPTYSDNEAEYPRLELSDETRMIPLYTETLEEDEIPDDPRAVINQEVNQEEEEEVDHVMIFTEADWEERQQMPSIPVKIEDMVDPRAETTTDANEQPVSYGSGPIEELNNAIASLQGDDATPFTEEDVAAIEAILCSTDDAVSSAEEPQESFLDYLLRDE